MKKTIMFLTFMSSTNLFAQVYFPLAVGNYWDYDVFLPGNEWSSWYTRIVGDTLIGGKKYAIWLTSPLDARFARQEGSKVFSYDEKIGEEYVCLDFLASTGDTICYRKGGNYLVIALGKLEFRRVDTTMSYFPKITWTIKDSIGIFKIQRDGWWGYDELNNATIDGKHFPLSVRANAGPSIPTSPTLYQNYPNPFNPGTNIVYEIPNRTMVSLMICDNLGRKLSLLVNTVMDVGVHSVYFDASRFCSGVYYCRLQVGSFSDTKKLTILK